MYYITLILAALISGVGLLMGSETAVRGSMLISPMLLPIFNMASNQTTISSGMKMFGLSVAICIFIGYVLSYATRNQETKLMTDRVQYRASIDSLFFNMVVPFLCGFVLAIAKKNNDILTMAGVGLAIAMLPPLVNAGIYLQRGQYDHFTKNMELAGINLTMMTLSYVINTRLLSR